MTVQSNETANLLGVDTPYISTVAYIAQAMAPYNFAIKTHPSLNPKIPRKTKSALPTKNVACAMTFSIYETMIAQLADTQNVRPSQFSGIANP
mmetsp:Transcript_16818/g.23029  ORF Transcript_16818/g.23029 Transcript_16818/m.23029 type:complete len:93 (+) Transcript_16818:625-903(+)